MSEQLTKTLAEDAQEAEGILTRAAMAEIDNRIDGVIQAENSSYALYSAEALVASLDDKKLNVSANLLIRRQLENVLPELFPPEYQKTGGEPFSPETAEFVLPRLLDLQKQQEEQEKLEPQWAAARQSEDKKKKSLTDKTWRKILTGETDHRRQTLGKSVFIAFLLKMDRDTLLKLFLADGGDGYDLHTPEGLAACFCMSQEQFFRYETYLSMTARLQPIFANGLSEQVSPKAAAALARAWIGENSKAPAAAAPRNSEIKAFVREITAAAKAFTLPQGDAESSADRLIRRKIEDAMPQLFPAEYLKTGGDPFDKDIAEPIRDGNPDPNNPKDQERRGILWRQQRLETLDDRPKNERDIGPARNTWMKILTGEKALVKNPIFVGFVLGMNAAETQQLLLACDKNGYDLRTPEGLTAWFCQSCPQRNDYGTYLRLVKKVRQELAQGQVGSDVQSESGTMLIRKRIDELSDKERNASDAEAAETAFVNEVQAHINELVDNRYSVSRKQMLMDLMEDLSLLCESRETQKGNKVFEPMPKPEFDPEDAPKKDDSGGIHHDPVTFLLDEVLYNAKRANFNEQGERIEGRHTQLPLPGNMGAIVSQLPTRIWEAKTDRAEVSRSTLMLLIFLLLSKYKENVDQPPELRSIRNKEALQGIRDSVAIMCADENETHSGRSSLLLYFTWIVDDIMTPLGYCPFYYPNRLDRCLLATFLVSESSASIGCYSTSLVYFQGIFDRGQEYGDSADPDES